ncbi:hypothetical protein [Zongyangia hominis]|uniref:AtpZ/AtpI family protein n=1 Tax=Zongyangia hominis TaxID=2763677 RepID=A0A926ECR8_9FIRM|nr:hypothetical protein [Zongyangia hominis]MBC8569844.1 AtpZ/AtpI family protein [Zongyangia hominis]
MPKDNGSPQKTSVIRGLVYYLELTLLLLLPILVLAWITYRLRQLYGWPNWTVIVGILLGTVAGIVCLYRFIMRQVKRDERHKDG